MFILKGQLIFLVEEFRAVAEDERCLPNSQESVKELNSNFLADELLFFWGEL